jgi:hypothetical protein
MTGEKSTDIQGSGSTSESSSVCRQAIIEAAALRIPESGEPESDIERSLVRLIEENRHNRFLAKDGLVCSVT